MDIEKELGYISTALNLLTAELKALNNTLKPKKADSPEYYRILNSEDVKKVKNLKVEDESIKDTSNEVKSFDFSSKKKEKNLSLAFIESSVSRDYLMKRLSYASNMGKGKEVSDIINSYEAINFAALKPKYYKDVLRDVEVLINGKTNTRRFN